MWPGILPHSGNTALNKTNPELEREGVGRGKGREREEGEGEVGASV